MQVPPPPPPPHRFVLKGKPAERNCSLVLSLFFLSSLLICPLRTQCCFGFVLFYYRHPDFPPPGLGDLHGQSLQQPARPVPPVPPVLLLLLPSAGLPPGLGHVPRGRGRVRAWTPATTAPWESSPPPPSPPWCSPWPSPPPPSRWCPWCSWSSTCTTWWWVVVSLSCSLDVGSVVWLVRYLHKLMVSGGVVVL